MIPTSRAIIFLSLGVATTLLTTDAWVAPIWGLIVAGACLLDWFFIPQSVQINAEPLSPVRLTQSTTHRLRVINTGKRIVRGALRDTWQPSAGANPSVHAIKINPGQTLVVNTQLFPQRRGHLYHHGFTLRTRSVLGLAWRQKRIERTGVLRVLPAFHSRRHLPSRLAQLREHDGQTSLLVRGEGTEFDSLREYVDGDDVRSLDWRASARHQKLVVRTWRPERDRQVVVLIDTSRLSAVKLGHDTRLDASIEVSLLLSTLALHAGDRVSVIAMDREVHSQLRHKRGTVAMPELAEGLSTVESALIEPDWPLMTKTILQELKGRALVVLCTGVDSAGLTSGMLPAATRLAWNNNVIVASALDPAESHLRQSRESIDDVYIAAGASQAAAERAHVANLLRLRGINVIEAKPDDLAPQVADRYLMLKAAGRL